MHGVSCYVQYSCYSQSVRMPAHSSDRHGLHGAFGATVYIVALQHARVSVADAPYTACAVPLRTCGEEAIDYSLVGVGGCRRVQSMERQLGVDSAIDRSIKQQSVSQKKHQLFLDRYGRSTRYRIGVAAQSRSEVSRGMPVLRRTGAGRAGGV